MANEILTSLALSDTSLVILRTKETTPRVFRFETATEMNAEEVIQEGEEKPLMIKGRLYANKPAFDTVLGYDITLKDNLFNPEVLCLLQGGTIEKENGKFKKYSAPIIGSEVIKTKFDMEVYSAIVETDGETGEYLMTTYKNCVGQNTPLSFADDNYFAAEYKVVSRPATGEAPYTCEVITGKPE